MIFHYTPFYPIHTPGYRHVAFIYIYCCFFHPHIISNHHTHIYTTYRYISIYTYITKSHTIYSLDTGYIDSHQKGTVLTQT